MPSLARFACLGSVGALLLACGGGAPAQAPKGEPSREDVPPKTPSSIEEAQTQIREAALALGTEHAESKADAASTTTAQPSTPAAEAPAKASPSAPPPRSPGAAGSSPRAEADMRATSEDRCASPCRALASMRRAVEALCRMTGESDARCTSAHETLATSEGRVASCHCGG